MGDSKFSFKQKMKNKLAIPDLIKKPTGDNKF